MTTFAERLAAAKAAPRPTKTVQVTLDAHISAEFERLRAELDEARQEYARDIRFAAAPADVDAVQAKLDALSEAATDSLVTLRFERLPGDVWSAITSRCPLRPGVLMDEHYGYNMQTAVKLAAPLCGVRVEGDEEFELVVAAATPETAAVDEWADLFSTISGAEFALIVEAVYELNVYEPTMRVEQLKKESAARPA